MSVPQSLNIKGFTTDSSSTSYVEALSPTVALTPHGRRHLLWTFSGLPACRRLLEVVLCARGARKTKKNTRKPCESITETKANTEVLDTTAGLQFSYFVAFIGRSDFVAPFCELHTLSSLP